MRRLDRFWLALETVPGLTCLRCEWQVLLGSDYQVTHRFLHPTDEEARYFPCPNPAGDGCPRRVVDHGTGSLVAVCGDSPRRCETVSVTRMELILYEVHLPALVSEIAAALEIVGRLQSAGVFSTWRVGEYGKGSRRRLPVYLAIRNSDHGLDDAVKELLLAGDRPFVLLAPTSSLLLPRSRDLLGTAGCGFAALDELIQVNGEDRLVAAAELSRFLVTATSPPDDEENVFRRDADKWTVRFQGRSVYLDDLKGLRYLQVLLANRDREYAPASLSIEAGEGAAPQHHASEDRLDGAGPDSAGPVLDEQARREYRERRSEIEKELADAELRHDLARAENLLSEKQQLEEAVLAAEGLGGRPRAVGDPRKRARDRVTNAITRCRKRIAVAHPELAAHLEASLKQGELWSYRPGSSVAWQT